MARVEDARGFLHEAVTRCTPETLNDRMEFWCVVYSDGRGNITDAPSSVRTPEVDIDLVTMDYGVSGHWKLMSGYSGQHGYRGPSMHASEYISGRMARDILSTPGYYVVMETRVPCYDDPRGNGVHCTPDEGCQCEPEGWAVAHLPMKLKGRG